MEKEKTMVEKLEEFFESEEGKASTKRFFDKIRDEQLIENRWVTKVVEKLKETEDLSDLFKKWNKHSEKRKHILYKRHIDGDSSLDTIIYSAMKELGEEDSDMGMFCQGKYEYKGFVTEYLVGQGVAILFYPKV